MSATPPPEVFAPDAAPAWYALRRTLPPWRFDELLAELLELAPDYRVDEVVVKVDTEEFSHGHPTVEWAEDYAGKLRRIRDGLAERGIVYSLNPWITVGHCDRGRDDRRKLPGLQTTVGHDGAECRHCACPLSPVWRAHVARLWTIYAQTEPRVLWIEDDIRTFNHEPVGYGCFCPPHLARFAREIGREAGSEITREELVEKILRPGSPHPWRAAYLDMQREVMIETVAFLARTVHAASPETRLGLMSSGARTHSLEGRDWPRFAAAMADGRPLYSRPPMGNYWEGSLRGLYHSRDSIQLTRHVMPATAVEQTEIENVPFTRHSKSVRFTYLETALSFASGVRGVTLNLFDHVGTPMAAEGDFGAMLRELKPFLNALAAEAQKPGRYRGVVLPFHPRDAAWRELAPGADYPDLGQDGAKLAEALESAGIATVYDAPPPAVDGGAPVVRAVSGQTPRAFTNDEIEAWLADGLFVDATAANILAERGFGADLGLESIEVPRHRRELPFVLSAEEHGHAPTGGAPRRYLTATMADLASLARFAVFAPRPEAEVVGNWVDPDTRPVAPAMIAFRNRLGGRVVVHGLDYSTGVGIAFHHPFRRTQLQGVFRFLADGRPELFCDGDGAYPLAWRKDTLAGEGGEAGGFMGLVNLNLDPWRGGSFEMAWSGRSPSFEVLDGRGRWRPDEDGWRLERPRPGVLRANFSRVVPPADLVAWRWRGG